jgi:hypothetical protein
MPTTVLDVDLVAPDAQQVVVGDGVNLEAGRDRDGAEPLAVGREGRQARSSPCLNG